MSQTFEFLLALVSSCSLEELEKLKDAVCREIQKKKREKPKICVKIEPSFENSDQSLNSGEIVSKTEETDPLGNEETPIVKIKPEEPKNDFPKVWTLTEEQRKIELITSSKLKPIDPLKPTPTFECEICGKTLNVTSKFHHDKMHSGEKPFKCQYCGKEFYRKSTKNNHERIHTGEKPFKCRFCDMAFADSSARCNHEKIHKGEHRNFKCNFCDKKFFSNWKRNQHEKSMHLTEVEFN